MPFIPLLTLYVFSSTQGLIHLLLERERALVCIFILFWGVSILMLAYMDYFTVNIIFCIVDESWKSVQPRGSDRTRTDHDVVEPVPRPLPADPQPDQVREKTTTVSLFDLCLSFCKSVYGSHN